MKLGEIFVEREVLEHPQAQKILGKFSQDPRVIENYQSLFGSIKRPYLLKRTSMNLFLARKRGELVKEAPPAYGRQGGAHYYYVHAYNCPYECTYCYLQGYFDSPDLVFFVNHEEIIQRMKEVAGQHSEVWFHGGEFSDSLALSHWTQELEFYADFFREHPQCYWELRTKSVNVREVAKLEPRENIIISFSLSPERATREHDLKTPSLKARLGAMAHLKSLGHRLAVHLDPIVYGEDLLAQYDQLLGSLNREVGVKNLAYLSMGVVRFSEKSFRAVRSHYPEESYLYRELRSGPDQKRKYPRAIRSWIFQKVTQLCLEAGLPGDKIYRCMEGE